METKQAATAQDDTEMEIESQAQHYLEQASSAVGNGARRASLDRAHTMPVSSYEEGHKVLQDFRLRRLAREAARSQKNTSSTSTSTASERLQRVSEAHPGSAPPSVLQTSGHGRSPSRRTFSSTSSLGRQRLVGDNAATELEPRVPLDQAASTPLPESATEASSSSRASNLAALPALGIGRMPSINSSDKDTSGRMSAKRALSDGPSTSRHSSSKSVKGEASLVRHSSLSRSLAVSKAQHNVNLTATPDRSLSTASTRRSVPPSSLDTAQQLVSVADKEANLSISTTSSLIDHGEAVDMKTASLAEDTPGDALSTSSLIDELRNHNIPTVDDTAYGIPKTVVLGGKSIDISDMEILEQIEMMRRAQDEAKKTASRLATDRLDSLSPIPALDIYQNMPSTDLSVIAERTECSTYSRRSTIAPTNRSESFKSPQLSSIGLHLAPTHTRSRLSISTTRSGLSGLSNTSVNAKDTAMTEAERIRNRYLRKAGKENIEEKAVRSSAQSSDKSQSFTPSHRKYTSVGETNFHTRALSPAGSVKSGAAKSGLSALGLSNIELPEALSKRPHGSVPLPSALKASTRPTSSRPSSITTADSADSRFVPSNVSSSAASGLTSPSKHIISPTISEKVERFRNAIPRPQDDYNVSPLYRKRSKSMHSDDRSARPLLSESASQLPPSPSMPLLSAMPPLKSTSALVQMFESKSVASSTLPGSSPVKEWLRKVDNNKNPPSPGRYPPAAMSVSSASGSMTDHNALARREAKYQAPRADSPSHLDFTQARKRSQSLTALPGVLIQEEEKTPSITRSASAFSLDDSEIVHHSDLYWLNSSSATLPPFWQSCRAILTAKDELRISWLGLESGTTHERFFDLSSCTAAHSIRRAPDSTTTVIQAYAPEDRPATREEVSRLQVFELVWPGRTQRFACVDLSSRIKWLGYIFEVLAKYSNPNTPLVEQIESPAGAGSLRSATVRSLDLPESSSPGRSGELTLASSPQEEVPRRKLEKEMQASLYASVSEMLDSQGAGSKTPSRMDDLPDIPKYRLTDCATPKAHASHTPSTSGIADPRRPLRGAWSDIERDSTRSEMPAGVAPAAKSVARDLKRILTLVGRSRSNTASSAVVQDFPDQLKEMQTQLERVSREIRSASVASRHSRHAPDMVAKMDEVLGLCKRIAEEHAKATATSHAKTALASNEATFDPPQKVLTQEQAKHTGLDRLEEKVETLLEVVNKLAATESPTGQKRSKSPEMTARIVSQADRNESASDGTGRAPVFTVPAGYAAAQRAFDMLPTTPDLMRRLDADFDKDIEQWKKYDKKRHSALPPLPPVESTSEQKKVDPAVMQALKEQADLTEFYDSLGRKAVETSSRPSSVVSSNRVRNARSDAAMRLEGSHPALLANLGKNVAKPSLTEKKLPASKWSADTEAPDQGLRQSPSATTVKQPSDERVYKNVGTLAPAQESGGSAMPRQQISAKANGIRPSPVVTAPSPALADKKTQDAMAMQLNSMEGLLNTLVTAQSKQMEALKHQEDVSVYIKYLQEYLAEDRTNRKEEFETIKSSLNSISQQLSALPKEIQTIVEASIAVAALQAPANAKDSKAPSMSPAPAPDNDLPIAETAIDGHETKAKEAIEVAKEIPTTSKTVPAGRSQGKKTGASLLRKVSLGLAGMAGASPGHPVIRVGGPRKMGTTRLFGHPPATAPPADARDRWRADRQQVAEGAPPAGTDLPGGSAPPMADPQAPLLDALEGLQEELKTGGDEENEDRQTIIALGIIELIKMVKDLEARQNERDHYRREDEILRMDLERERHAEQLEAVRKELRDWEAKREELAARPERDPENEQGIDQIIALLKDSMAHQELALVNLKDTLTPKIKDIGLESEEAILAIREEMSKSLAEFRLQLDDEVKKTLDEVGALRDQKKQLQSDLSDLLAFKSKYGGGAPEDLQQKQQPLKPAAHAGLYAQPAYYTRPTARQAQLPAYPPPRPDTSLSNAIPTWGLRGPR